MVPELSSETFWLTVPILNPALLRMEAAEPSSRLTTFGTAMSGLSWATTTFTGVPTSTRVPGSGDCAVIKPTKVSLTWGSPWPKRATTLSGWLLRSLPGPAQDGGGSALVAPPDVRHSNARPFRGHDYVYGGAHSASRPRLGSLRSDQPDKVVAHLVFHLAQASDNFVGLITAQSPEPGT